MKLLDNMYVIRKCVNTKGRGESAAMEILYYADSRGVQPVLEWLEKMRKHEREVFNRTIIMTNYLMENGLDIQSRKIKHKDIKKLKGTDDIWQLRIKEDRVLFFYFGKNSIVFTNQFRKKKNETPANEIERAETRKKDWLSNQDQDG